MRVPALFICENKIEDIARTLEGRNRMKHGHDKLNV